MRQLVANFPIQLHEALVIGQSYKFLAAKKDFTNVILTGLGGSGIGGSIVQNYVFDKLKIPFIVNKDYFLPSFVSANSLVIVSSYSGNTEETVAALQQAIKAKATIVCITSGGKVAEIARKKKIDCILLPAGMPPRSCVGYSMTQVLFTLKHFGLVKDNFEKEIKASIKLLKEDVKDIQKKAQVIAKKLYEKTPIIYAAADFEGVAVRFRQQLNENSKVLCWHHVIPEMNHNELVGWRDKDSSKAVIILRNEDDYERVQMRIEINKQVIKKYTNNIIEIYSKGKSYWEKAIYLIHLTDWVSVMLADLRGQNATEVKVIDFLKGELSKA
ncbi:bifunctional phosphoglucose/phosphomannose isomerase [Polluticoccus soli]|uniref:bifunctional phosphoglucose/phosphomannose isomerase n=1 Tax=Polluticoccus soli TaxID=3034150 RepID=UPI0023E1E134|nr:bifunctional phosphoglucose/phosphomannose isomerase [Flavipsychrobacter sp. JY13-12]